MTGGMMTREHDVEVYAIRASDGSVGASIVPELGAVVSSLRFAWRGTHRETLFRHDYFWDRAAERTRGGFPFLFPVCARLERDGVPGLYLYDGHRYEMKIHGFAMRMPWTVVEHTDSSLTVTLGDTEATRSCYPFRFLLTLEFEVKAGVLTIRQTYANTGSVAMPYYAGFHPYFLTPPPGQGKEQVQIRYAMKAMLNYNSRLTDIVGQVPPVPTPLKVTDPVLIERLTAIGEDREVCLEFPDGMTLHTRADGVEDERMFRFVQLYTMVDKPFFCVEPWMAPPNTLNSVTGSRWIGAGQTERGVVTVRVS